MLRKNWREYEVTGNEEEYEGKRLYVLFEEDDDNKKHYDLTRGIFTNLEVAIEYAKEIKEDEEIFCAYYSDYIDGNYSYINMELPIQYLQFQEEVKDILEEYKEIDGDVGLSLKIEELEKEWDENFPELAPFIAGEGR